MMWGFRLVVIFVFFSNYIFSQTLDAQVMSSTGSYFSNQYTLSSTTGETIVYDYLQEGYKIHQGFQQIALDLYCSYECVLHTHTIDLPEGWSYWSTYLSPKETSMEDIFSQINQYVLILKDQNGEVYWPYFGINGIDDHIDGQGYQIKMSEDVYLDVEGYKQINPMVTLYQDWNILGCLYYEPTIIEEAMSPIIENVILIKDENANVYWPFLGINTIEYIIPGEGYSIKMGTDVNFTFYNQSEEIFRFLLNTDVPEFFYYRQPINTGQNMTIGFTYEILKEYMDYGDEIAAFDKYNNIVGLNTFYDKNLALTIWGNDYSTSEKDGMYELELFNFRIWNKKSQKENKIKISDWLQGSDFYVQDGINIANNISLDSELDIPSFYFFPNPTSSKIELKFNIPEDGFVKIFINNNLGEKRYLLSQQLTKGEYDFEFLVDEAPGLYYITMESCNNSKTIPMSVVK